MSWEHEAPECPYCGHENGKIYSDPRLADESDVLEFDCEGCGGPIVSDCEHETRTEYTWTRKEY